MNILVIDIGGNNVKMLTSEQRKRRKIPSGPGLTARRMVAAVKAVTTDWKYDVISIGFPGPQKDGSPIAEPRNLGKGWVGFNFSKAFGVPVRLINDAAMQALGAYKSGNMLFLGLGTGLGSCLIVEGKVAPLELGHLPYKQGTYEDYVGRRGLLKLGRKKWSREVTRVVDLFIDALHPDEVVLGGGNAKKLLELPPRCHLGHNRDAFVGGFRMWEPDHAIR